MNLKWLSSKDTMAKQLGVIILLTVLSQSLCLSDNNTTDEIVGKFTQLSADQTDWNLPIDYFSSDNVTVIFVHTNISEEKKAVKNISACDATETELHCTNIDIFEIAKTLPPTTQFIDISNSPVSTLRESIFQNLTQLVHLKLSNNSIRYITSKLFVGLENLRKLNLSNNHIMVLTKQTFRGCPGLEEIDVSRNRIITLNVIPIALGMLTNLTTVSFAYNDLGMIKSENLLPLQHCSIETLDFSFCNITRVAYGSFRYLPNLKNLKLKVAYLDDQSLSDVTSSLSSSIRSLDLRLLPRITGFPASAMSFLENSTLEQLDMSFNKFPTVSNQSFGFMPHLKYLRLLSSSIATISEDAFDGIASLERLDLSDNYLTGIPPAISVLKNLKMLYINKQSIDMLSKFVIPDGLLSNLTQLELLTVNHNRIDNQINIFTFHGLSKLHSLSLFQCGIFHIEDNAFSSLTSLRYLELSYNKIFSITAKQLNGLKNLRILRLKENGLIVGMNQNPFTQTPLLEYLDLYRNKLSVLKSGLFSTLTNLTKIDLRQNKIKSWNHTIFARNGNLKELRASNNEIAFVTSAMIEDFEGLTLLDLSYNPFDCANCKMERFQSWLIHSNLTSSEDRVVYMCSFPAEFSGYSIFEELPFDHCWPISFTLILQLSIGLSVFFVALIIILILFSKFKWYIRYWCFHMHSTIKRLSINAETTPYFFDAFVSYNSSDIAWVANVLLPTLESYSSSLKLCIHDRDFEVGRLITENILEAIDKSKKVLLVLTDSFVKSEWCLFELHVAQHRLFHDTRDALVLVQLGDIDKSALTKNLKYLMHTRTLLVWPENPDKRKDFWNRLYKILNE